MHTNLSKSKLPLLVGALFAFVLFAGVPASSLGSAKQELVFLTWSEYMDPEVLTEFEEKFNAKVNFVYFESDDIRTEILAEHDGKGFDLILASGLSLAPYSRQGWLTPISESDIPNANHINPRWANAFPGAAEYAVPYFWGTTGIAYREDLFPEGFKSWKDLFSPPESLRGKIVMMNFGRDIMGVALKALGYSMNTNDKKELAEAEQLLQQQKPYVHSYSYVILSEESALITGEVWATMMYSGDVLMLQEHAENIAYVLPEEGGNIWVDYLTIAQASNKKELAMQFINFLNEPEIAARLAEFVYYATPNEAAEQYLPEEYFEDPVIYPSEEQLSRSEFHAPLAPRVQQYTNEIVANLIR
jgi:spermidine/putrescine transport system substrate-binding protein